MTPEQEEQVRRALASAPPAGAMPPEVAARLDTTLADLVAERSAVPAGEPDTDLATVVALEERRRRRWPRVLVAAASVSVLAYGAGIALEGLEVSGGGAESTAARDETLAGAGQDSADGGAEAAPGDVPTGLVTDSEGTPAKDSRSYADRVLVPGIVQLRTETLDEDVRRLVRDGVVTGPRTLSPQDARALAGFLDQCERPGLARGDRIAAVRLDGRRATLVVRKAVGGTRVAQIYACGDATSPLATTRVPRAR